MPLQKTHPRSVVFATNPPLTDVQVYRQRRRTLHTISELSTSNVTLPGLPSTIDSVEDSANKAAKKHWRRSLPQNVSNLVTKPTISLTPADAQSLRRSSTEPLASTHGANGNIGGGSTSSADNTPKRLSLNPASRNRLSQIQLSPVVEGKQSNSQRPVRPVSLPAGFGHAGYSAMQAARAGEERQRNGEGWNARRERERLKLEQAVAEAKARRERGHGIPMGSSATLPSLSPMPTAKPKKSAIMRVDSQQQLSQALPARNSNRVPNPLIARASLAQLGNQPNNSMQNGQLLKRASTGGAVQVGSRRNSVQRSGSARADSSRAPTPATPVNQPMPQMVRSASSRSLSNPIAQNRYPPSRTPSSTSLRPSPNLSRSPSVQSNVSRQSQVLTPAQAGLATRGLGQQVLQKSKNGHLELSPPLVNTTSKPKVPPRSINRPSSGTDRTSSSPELDAPRQNRETRNRYTLTPTRSRSQSQSRYRSSVPQFQEAGVVNGVSRRESSGARGSMRQPRKPSLLEEREKMLQWREEKEALESEKSARESVKERVKRANELEEEKEKELEKRSRSFFCGLFGKA